jgi:hypothetical protein
MPVRLDETAAKPPAIDSPSSPSPIIERPTPGIEIELTGGRRPCFDRDADPDMVQAAAARGVRQ